MAVRYLGTMPKSLAVTSLKIDGPDLARVVRIIRDRSRHVQLEIRALKSPDFKLVITHREEYDVVGLLKENGVRIITPKT